MKPDDDDDEEAEDRGEELYTHIHTGTNSTKPFCPHTLLSASAIKGFLVAAAALF